MNLELFAVIAAGVIIFLAGLLQSVVGFGDVLFATGVSAIVPVLRAI